MSPYAHVIETILAKDETAALAAIAALEPAAAWPDIASPILEALYRDMEGVPGALVAKGYKPSLLEAAAMGDLAAVTAHLSAAAPTDVISGDGWTPLHLAAFLGRAEATRALLAFGADHHAVSHNPTANQPLHAAIAGRGDGDTIAALIDAGADVAFPAGGGYRPLHLAAARGNAALCDVLLDEGADPAARTDDGKTPADIATERGHTMLAEVLRGLVPASL